MAVAQVIVLSFSSPAVASGILPGANPASNATPSPNFLTSGPCANLDGSWSCANPCISGTREMPVFSDAPQCTSYVLAAIDTARKAEKVGPMVLPTNWQQLDPQEQLFVLADLERTARGLPPYLGLNVKLTADAQRAAQQDEDPSLAPGFPVGVDFQGYYGMGGAWSSGFSPLVADFFWMYADGWGGASRTSNEACTSPRGAACWAHRDELLGYDPRFNPGVGLWCKDCEMGTGFAITGDFASFVDLIELPASGPPPMTFTWAHDVVPYLAQPRAHRAHATSHARLRNVVDNSFAHWTSHVAPRCSVNRSPQRRAGCRTDLHTTRQIVASASKEEQ